MTDKPNPLIFLAYLDEFAEALQEQLESDTERHGTEYLDKPRAQQSMRIFRRITEYFNEFALDGKPIPWLKVAGLAFIAWLRETHPELSPRWKAEDKPRVKYPRTLE